MSSLRSQGLGNRQEARVGSFLATASEFTRQETLGKWQEVLGAQASRLYKAKTLTGSLC